MERIASFCIDHNKLMPGIYVSRKDSKDGCTVTTFDLRMTAPNREPVMDTGTVHTLEHIIATFLRNSDRKGEVIYFGPMGCRTGFYLVMFGDLDAHNVQPLVKQAFEFAANFEGDIPGATAVECGNYSDQNLDEAKRKAKKYLVSIKQEEI